MQAQQLKNLASEQLQTLEQSLRQRQQNSQGKSSNNGASSRNRSPARRERPVKRAQHRAPAAGRSAGQDEPGDDERVPGENGEPQRRKPTGKRLESFGQRGATLLREVHRRTDVKLHRKSWRV